MFLSIFEKVNAHEEKIKRLEALLSDNKNIKIQDSPEVHVRHAKLLGEFLDILVNLLSLSTKFGKILPDL